MTFNLGRRAPAIAGLALSLLIAGLSGCADKGSSDPAGPDDNQGLKAKWSGSDGIQAFFAQRCTPCHITQSQNGFNLSTYANAMDGGRIVPGDPDNSLLVQKLSPTPPFDDRMPRGGPYLTAAETDSIRLWITNGALNN